MKKSGRFSMIGCVAIALALVMIGSSVSLTMNANAVAEPVQTVVVTSPFTAAIAEVKDSVVGVSNRQVVRYSNFNGFNGFGNFGGFGSFDDFFNWGNGNGNNGRSNPGSTQEQEVEAATGSGVVIAKDYVLTNYHVVENANTLKITVAREDSDTPDVYSAVLVASDANVDIAVVYCPDLPVEPVKLGDSDSLQVGDWAICIGNPLSMKFSGTVTAGIVSAMNRSVSSTNYDKYGRRETTTNSMIQVDAAINSGNSGGGMFSTTGELMGIPTMKYSGSAFSGSSVEGIGLCIPINAAKPLINDVLSGAIKTPQVESDKAKAEADNSSITSATRPRIGITMASINTNSSAVRSGQLPTGVYVTDVEAGSPAEKAGMQVADIIVDVNDNVISSTSQLQSIVAEYNTGDTLKIKVYRVPGLADLGSTDEIPDGEYIDLDVTLAIIDTVQQ